ncbi:hypothetical protein LTR84_001595 [Exophiala bonariae]|uniref:Right handed beta helix domain-containing protein n=1 Tax=Exophiala bonariae TaxID=1690606 RepID=A0AAV9NFJ3_9EURO|nr:hypothetical protein LTR84_001595 [Exophiala bonariae]
MQWLSKGLSLILLGVPSFATGSGHGNPIYVSNGQSIQSAIASAPPGSQIIVTAGTYAEQLTIKTDGITLVGHGAILTPPASPTQNECTGLAGPDTNAGICIVGSQVALADFVVEHRKVISVGRRVKNVAVTGFDVRGFSGPSITAVGGENVAITGNHLFDGAQYGALSVGSLGSTIDNNAIESTGDLKFIGICMDDNLGGGVTVKQNTIQGYVIALCIQTNHAQVSNNDATNCCIGASLDPSIDGIQLTANHFGPTDPRCAQGDPPPGAYGVLIAGSINAVVKGNVIEGFTVAGGAPGAESAAIVVLDDVFTNTGALATDNIITGNVLRNNDYDIAVLTNGTGNVVQGNVCTTPPELCG